MAIRWISRKTLERLMVLLLSELRRIKVVFLTNQKLVVYNDDFRYMWAPTYGIWPYNSYGFTGESEISPVGKTAVRDVGLNMRHYEVSIHFTLYNKVLKKIITDGVYEANADVKNYSSEADDIGRNVRQYMTQGILDRIIATTCPETYQVERVLYARGTNDKVDGFIQQGLELAAGGRWEHAASKWKNAILEDKNNALAFHNLGIYYEKKGELTKASEFFDQAEEKNYWKLIEQNRFQKTLEEFVPKLDLAQLQPRVISVRGGRWVSIAGKLGRKFKLRKNYPVVRVEQKINKPNFNNEGLVYTEVGRVQVIQKRGRLILAKIIEFVEDKGIQNGDIILL
ncbi:MAG: hypothetical protein R3B45_11015 [Bdellovibrionota bacterium]